MERAACNEIWLSVSDLMHPGLLFVAETKILGHFRHQLTSFSIGEGFQRKE